MSPRFSLVLFLAAACGGPPKPVDPHDVKGPGDLGGKNVTLPHTPGVAYVDLECTSPEESCNYPPPFEMHVVADKVKDCRANEGAGTLAIHLNNKTDSTVAIEVTLDQGFQGAGRYPLDKNLSRWVNVAMSTNLATWREAATGGSCSVGDYTGAPNAAGTPVGAPDSCGSDACQLTVVDRNPSATYPKQLEFTVQCNSLCINGSQPAAGKPGTVCKQWSNVDVAQAIDFSFTATCAP